MSVLEQSVIALREAGCSVDSQMGYYMVRFPEFTRLSMATKNALNNELYKSGSKTYSRSHFQFCVMKAWLEVEA